MVNLEFQFRDDFNSLKLKTFFQFLKNKEDLIHKEELVSEKRNLKTTRVGILNLIEYNETGDKHIRDVFLHVSKDFRFIFQKKWMDIEVLNKDKIKNIENYIAKVYEIVMKKYVENNDVFVYFITKIKSMKIPIQFDKDDPTIIKTLPTSKPINVERYQFLFDKNYLYSPKVDGITTFIIYYDKGVFLLNTQNITKISQETYKKPSILLGELLDEKIFIFDALMINNEFISRDTLEMRLSKIKQIPLKSNISSVPYYKTFKEALFNDFFKDICDGVILTPIDKPYINDKTYKWKPPSKLTIDFLMKREGGEFKLFVRDRDKIVPFEGDQKSIRGDLVDGKIGEFRYNKHAFELIRIRYDKIQPNSKLLAINIWKDIQHPITSNEVLSFDKQKPDDVSLICDQLKKNPENILNLRNDWFFIFKKIIKNSKKSNLSIEISKFL